MDPSPDIAPTRPILVAGASGALGGAIARKLLAAGLPVRALSRSAERLRDLEALGADVLVGDLLDAAVAERACDGARQVVSTANNLMGSGPRSPMRVDVRAHEHLCHAAARAGVERIVNVSAYGIGPDSPVDFFRVKYRVDDTIRASGIPFVLLQPTAFMETWIDQVLGQGIRAKGVAVLFGTGTRITNFVAIEDVAEVAARIVANDKIRNETIVVGGPTNASYEQIATLIERAMGKSARRQRIPVPVLRLGSLVMRPFNEVTARMMALGYFSATRDSPQETWRITAERFGITPISAETYVAAHYGGSAPARTGVTDR